MNYRISFKFIATINFIMHYESFRTFCTVGSAYLFIFKFNIIYSIHSHKLIVYNIYNIKTLLRQCAKVLKALAYSFPVNILAPFSFGSENIVNFIIFFCFFRFIYFVIVIRSSRCSQSKSLTVQRHILNFKDSCALFLFRITFYKHKLLFSLLHFDLLQTVDCKCTCIILYFVTHTISSIFI